jgi:hypothetical protein
MFGDSLEDVNGLFAVGVDAAVPCPDGSVHVELLYSNLTTLPLECTKATANTVPPIPC